MAGNLSMARFSEDILKRLSTHLSMVFSLAMQDLRLIEVRGRVILGERHPQKCQVDDVKPGTRELRSTG